MDEYWFLSLPITIVMTISTVIGVFACICGCKTKEMKDELVGLEGHVKITNPDVNDCSQECDVVDGNITSAKRSLPDLPIDEIPVEPAWEPGGDASSELYATVGLHKAQRLRRSESDSISPSLQEHPYDRLKKIEHPYAQLRQGEPLPISVPSTEAEIATVQSIAEAPPESPHSDIHAAPAIAGHISATDDLPYITPPTHFSGDSQDSAKGYTSISVREPLSTIRTETKVRRPERQYATVSDDSDDMYAAIEEQTSGSETYAQIRPTPLTNRNVIIPINENNIVVTQTLNVTPCQAAVATVAASAPVPPSVDSLKQMTVSTVFTLAHSRQASSSSAASSSVVGSPKPEKRPANSPLPAPPSTLSETAPLGSAEDIYSRLSYQGSPRKNLDDMYAKVNKKRKFAHVSDHLERGQSVESMVSSSSESMSVGCTARAPHACSDNSTTSPSVTNSRCSQACHGHSTTTTTSNTTESSISHPRLTLDQQEDSSCASDDANDDDDDDPTNPCYERMRDAGYETLGDPAYETLNLSQPCYETLNKRSHRDPSYETLDKGPPSDSDPNYEKIKDPDYASINHGKGRLNGTIDVDGYTTVDKPISDIYAIVNKNGNNVNVDRGGVGEPAYESLNLGSDINEPNYESVQFTSKLNNEHIDPPYQLLAECESGTSPNL